LAVASSFRGKVLPTKTAVFGEVGLTGEVRAVRFAENRLAELARSGFSRVILPKRNTRGLVIPKELTVIEVTTVAQALTHLEEFE
jgi:DNA repair protein RadA/Sms